MERRGPVERSVGGFLRRVVDEPSQLSKCKRCKWPLENEKPSLCAECQRTELFKVAAKIASRAILSQQNLLLRLRLIKKFFGVCINTWETLSLLGPVQSATRSSSSTNTLPSGDSVSSVKERTQSLIGSVST